MSDNHYISELNIDEDSLPSTSPDMMHERRVAIFDLLEENMFKPEGSEGGPYLVNLSLQENRLLMEIRTSTGVALEDIALSLTPFRRVIKDYFLICESYHNAIRTAMPSQIEAIDMGRRGLHNEGSRMLTDALRNRAEVDHATARRIFTLLCALHRRPRSDFKG